jgi:histidinol-phosphate aminotransferase
VDYVKRVTSPFNVNIVAQRLAVLVLKNWEYFKERIQFIIKEREWLGSNLAKIDGIGPYPSDANFILFRVDKTSLSSSTVTKRLENRNVLVKDRGNLPLLTNCIRVTMGTRKMNEAFLSALKESLEG